ncbi:MAG TPA: hypothetical protein VEX41_05235 [Candidatus Eisenbacteria bacterium]|nr:hypothetical protein [Candidatus Eisenbacteria bacterium]
MPSRVAQSLHRRRRGVARHAGEEPLQECDPVSGDRVLAPLDGPPDRGRPGDRLVLRGERLDADRPTVTDLGDRRGNRGPVEFAVAPGRVARASESLEAAGAYEIVIALPDPGVVCVVA